MTDLEMTILTARAMGHTIHAERPLGERIYLDVGPGMMWSPLISAEQCVALVKKFGIRTEPWPAYGTVQKWIARLYDDSRRQLVNDRYYGPTMVVGDSPDYNRAIVECVAKMQAAALPQDSR